MDYRKNRKMESLGHTFSPRQITALVSVITRKLFQFSLRIRKPDFPGFENLESLFVANAGVITRNVSSEKKIPSFPSLPRRLSKVFSRRLQRLKRFGRLFVKPVLPGCRNVKAVSALSEGIDFRHSISHFST